MSSQYQQENNIDKETMELTAGYDMDGNAQLASVVQVLEKNILLRLSNNDKSMTPYGVVPGLMGALALGLMGTWAHGHLSSWALGLMGTWAHGHLGSWAQGLMGTRAHGHLGSWALGLMGT
jgi:hypothetical protein